MLAAFVHGLSSRWNYPLRVTDWTEHSASELLPLLESTVRWQLIPALTGHAPPASAESCMKLDISMLGFRVFGNFDRANALNLAEFLEQHHLGHFRREISYVKETGEGDT